MSSNMLMTIIENREKGGFPVSIGTSLAIEGACGVYPDRPESPAPILKAKQVWFNVRTIIRNLIEAIPTSYREILTVGVLYPALVEELTIIDGVILRGSNGLAQCVFYLCNYTFLHRKFPRAMLRQSDTPKQRLMKSLEEGLLKKLAEDGVAVDYRYFSDVNITGHYPEALIVTHLPVDLLSRYSFKRLDLLESHTGVIKPFTQWNSKLTGGSDNLNIPFCAMTLQLLGDKGNQFMSMPSQLKKQVVQLAEEDNWSPVTTNDKIRLSLRRITDPVDRATLTALL